MGIEQKIAAHKFFKRWAGKGKEKSHAQSFWRDLLQNVFGIQNVEEYIEFEKTVTIENTKFIDAYIPSTKVLIEQKSLGIDLSSRPSGDKSITPYEQASRYAEALPYSERPRWIVTCNFAEFWIYDMEHPNTKPAAVVKLADLEREYHRLQFLVDKDNIHLKKEAKVSFDAGRVVKALYEALEKQYSDDSKRIQHYLNVLCVRLVFCFYAEDAGIFAKDQFYNYMNPVPPSQMREALMHLFNVLNTPEDKRSEYLSPQLAEFPYVNGGLFSDQRIDVPPFTEKIKNLLLEKASADIDWSDISPTIFGSVFENTLNPETRNQKGIHYTTVENIHRVIDPLFLNDLREELARILASNRTETAKLLAFQEKLASLTFLDPACGSGNFLTETYLSLRRMENDVLRKLYPVDRPLAYDTWDIIKVSISQFYGIEINDFAVSVAKTALWIAESQMMKETIKIVEIPDKFLPLKTNANIKDGNALRMDWGKIIEANKLSYIMGNPPFVGSSKLLEWQKKDRSIIFSDEGGELDYVACWYKKAADYIKHYPVRCAFVSTNSICQGQQVVPLWQNLMKKGIVINFAYRKLIWDSESYSKAHVYFCIIGFSRISTPKKLLFYDEKTYTETKNINAYLLDGPNIFVEKRRLPLCNVPIVIKGFQPTDNGHLILDDNEKEEILSKEPGAEKWIRPFITAREYIHGKNRWCLWLKGISPAELGKLPLIKSHVDACKEWRKGEKKTGDAYKLKDKPSLMRPNTQFKEGKFIVFPLHTSEKRQYVPFGFDENNSIPGNSVSVAIGATLYHFGVLSSSVHMNWMRAVCGRLEGRYRYASDIVYNTFPWPNPTAAQKAKIEQTAQAILEARKLFPDSNLADLYDGVKMPPELIDAHKKNDRAVMEAYGFTRKTAAFSSESECDIELMKLYKKLAARAK